MILNDKAAKYKKPGFFKKARLEKMNENYKPDLSEKTRKLSQADPRTICLGRESQGAWELGRWLELSPP